MVLQASGSAIKFSEIQSEFGGTNPISLSEYYIGGDNVPATISSTTAGTFSAYYGRTPSSKITNSNSSSSFPVTFSGTPSDGNEYYYRVSTVNRGFQSGGFTLPSAVFTLVWAGVTIVADTTGSISGSSTSNGTLGDPGFFGTQSAFFILGNATNAANTILIQTGGFIYQLGPTIFATDSEADPGVGASPNTFDDPISYGIVRRKAETTTVSSSVNPNVPASGEVSMSDYYGGRDD
jgi:hypothetical protein